MVRYGSIKLNELEIRCFFDINICHRGVNFAPASFDTKGPFEVANLGKSQGIEVSQGIGDANHLLGGVKPRRAFQGAPCP